MFMLDVPKIPVKTNTKIAVSYTKLVVSMKKRQRKIQPSLEAACELQLGTCAARVSTENHNSALKTGKGSSVWNRAGSAAVWRRLPERVGFRRMEKKSQRLRDRNGRM